MVSGSSPSTRRRARWRSHPVLVEALDLLTLAGRKARLLTADDYHRHVAAIAVFLPEAQARLATYSTAFPTSAAATVIQQEIAQLGQERFVATTERTYLVTLRASLVNRCRPASRRAVCHSLGSRANCRHGQSRGRRVRTDRDGIRLRLPRGDRAAVQRPLLARIDLDSETQPHRLLGGYRRGWQLHHRRLPRRRRPRLARRREVSVAPRPRCRVGQPGHGGAGEPGRPRWL